jgi:hypothetical protein
LHHAKSALRDVLIESQRSRGGSLFVVVGTTSLLMALVSTAALFLRQRTASLADIQLRLATLEALLASETADDR